MLQESNLRSAIILTNLGNIDCNLQTWETAMINKCKLLYTLITLREISYDIEKRNLANINKPTLLTHRTNLFQLTHMMNVLVLRL